MTEELKKYEASIKRKHSIAWTPSYKERFRTVLNKTVFIPLVLKTFEKLGWELLYQDEVSAEAKRKRDAWQWGQKIVVTFENGNVSVKSVSLGSEMWDIGRNSIRVKLFIYAFQQMEKECDEETLMEIEKEAEKNDNWDDYIVPESLPQPRTYGQPRLWVPILLGVFSAFVLGYIVAHLSVHLVYLIGVFELAVGLLIGVVLKQSIKLGNYTHYDNLHFLLIGMVLITYISNQYFQYLLIMNENHLTGFSFYDFMSLRFEKGLILKSLNTGWIGLVLSWVFQLVFTYLMGLFNLSTGLINYQLGRTPPEVVDFVGFLLVRGKSEVEVKDELAKMGWSKKEDQDRVIESIGALYGASELNRMG